MYSITIKYPSDKPKVVSTDILTGLFLTFLCPFLLFPFFEEKKIKKNFK